MSTTVTRPSNAWIAFSYLNVLIALSLIGCGLLYVPVDLWVKGYFLMATVMTISSTVIVTKTLRDREEADKSNRIDNLSV